MARDLAVLFEDIPSAIDRNADETSGLGSDQFAASWRSQYIVERALLIISEASRAIPDLHKEKHPEIRWIGVRDIGNVLRHQYA